MAEKRQWVLITVTGDGQVNTSYHLNEREAQEAQSLALTGLTLEENERADKAYEKYEKEKMERARNEATLRDPTPDERAYIEKYGNLWGGGWSNGCYAGFDELTEDGKIRQVKYPDSGMSMSYSSDKGESVDMVRGQWVLKNRSSVKTAKIVGPVVSTEAGSSEE